MAFLFSKHSLEQMNARGIAKESVEQILDYPLEIIHTHETTIYQGIISENNKSYLIRIFVNEIVDPNIIIPVYKTSKIKKYHEGKIQ